MDVVQTGCIHAGWFIFALGHTGLSKLMVNDPKGVCVLHRVRTETTGQTPAADSKRGRNRKPRTRLRSSGVKGRALLTHLFSKAG